MENVAEEFDEYVRTQNFAQRERLPSHEFKEQFENKLLGKNRSNISRDGYSLLSCIISLYQHLTTSEIVILTSLSLGMTLFFCYYYYPALDGEDYRLAASLRFNLIGTAVLFPSTMLVSETMRRRENALQRYAALKGVLCNLLLAYLTWRDTGIHMTSEWEAKSFEVTKRAAGIVQSLLLLPTIRDRHSFTNGGRQFATEVKSMRTCLHAELMKVNFEMHVLVEDLKAQGMTPMESIRLFQYISNLFRDFEQIWCVKIYRTARAARTFVRIVLSACLMFYGPYFAYVAGGIMGSSNRKVNIPFACALSLMSTVILLAIVCIHRATEDPFLWHYPGNAIDVRLETADAIEKMETIYYCHRNKPDLQKTEGSA
jgi:hypothetical protein